MAPRWQQQLADAWAAELLELAGTGNTAAVAAAAERAEAALDPAISPLLTLLLANGSSATARVPGDMVFGWTLRGYLRSPSDPAPAKSAAFLFTASSKQLVLVRAFGFGYSLFTS